MWKRLCRPSRPAPSPTIEENNPVGYPLAWESLKDGLVQLLRQVIAQDLSELSQSGFAPVSLETGVTARLPADWPEPLNGLTIRGRMDRIDRNDSGLRVIDYKFKFGAKPASQDTNLLRAALRGERLQPPFYYMLAQHWAEEQTTSSHRDRPSKRTFTTSRTRWAEGPLLSTSYGSAGLTDQLGAATQQTIAYLADGVRQGRFFLNRGDYCGRCDAAADLPKKPSAEPVARRQRSGHRTSSGFARKRSQEIMSANPNEYRTTRRQRPPNRHRHLRSQSRGHRGRGHRQNDVVGRSPGAFAVAQSRSAKNHRHRRPYFYQ